MNFTKMARVFFAVALIGLFAFLAHSILPNTADAGSKRKVLLISVDGFRPDFYLQSDFHMPTVKHLKETGAWATSAMSVFPSVTYPNHTTLITGVYTNRHGVLSNSLFDWKNGPQSAW